MKTRLTVELSPGSSLRHQPEILGYLSESSSSSTTATAVAAEYGRQSNDGGGGSSCNDDSTFIIHAQRLSLSHTVQQQEQQPVKNNAPSAAVANSRPLHPFAAVFVSSTITESALDDFKGVKMAAQEKSSRKSNSIGSSSNNDTHDDNDDDYIVSDSMTRQRLSQRLLSLVHSFLARNFSVKAILKHNNGNNSQKQQQHQQHQHAPSDIILLDLSHAPEAAIDDMLQATNCQLVHSGPEAILKILLISQLVLTLTTGSNSSSSNNSNNVDTQQQEPEKAVDDNNSQNGLLLEEPSRTCWDIPTCPVCLHRIDPRRLGLPRPENHQLCSKFCPPPNYSGFQHYYYDHYDDDFNFNSNNNHRVSSSDSSITAYALPCSRQRLLRPWPSPSYCIACRVIDKYWKSSSSSTSSSTTAEGVVVAAAAGRRSRIGDDDVKNNHRQGIFCFQCSLQETLWVCLTCGFVGCGRYSNKHAAHHFVDTGHPYSLELATLRIWDYVASDFATRTDLLECPSSPPLMHPWMSSGMSHIFNNIMHLPTTMDGNDNHRIGNTDDRKPAAAAAAASSSEATSWGGGSMNGNNASSAQHLLHAAYYHDMGGGGSWGGGAGGGFVGAAAGSESKTPKKATMIGEEYEALLQSALEEQAQHYEGEITHLRARLTAENVDQSTMTVDEGREIESLQSEIANLRSEIDRVSRELVDSQAQEAGHRATSQRLLREQQVVQELLLKIRIETSKEHEEGKMQVEELEQQIADLTANQRMRDQFSQDEELQQAQIFGTANNNNDNNNNNNNNKSNKKSSGKKTRRFFRK